MSLGFGILGFLNYRSMSGYDLAKAFSSSLKFFWHAQNSHIYLELKKLEKQGYITGEAVIQSDRPNKRLFSITNAGRQALLHWLAQGSEDELTHLKSEFLMKIFFSGNVPPEQSAAMLRQFKMDCEAYLKQMGGTPKAIQHYGADKDSYQTMYWEFTADFGYSFIRTCIDWAQRCIEQLENLKEGGFV